MKATAIGLAVLCCLALLSCTESNGPGTGTPGEGSALDVGRTPGSICVPRGKDGAKTFGAMDLRNVTDSDVVITRVGLAGARGMEVVGSQVVASTPNSQVVADGWPPLGRDLRQEFATGRSATRTVLGPNEVVTLWTGLRAVSGDGSARAVRIYYRQGERNYRQDGVDSVRVTSRSSC